MKFNKEIFLTFSLSLCIFLIPTILISSMNLENSIVPQISPNTEWTDSTQTIVPMAIASTQELENVQKTASGVGFGTWRTGPKATASTGGTISKSVTASFSLTFSATISATSSEFSSAFGFANTYLKNVTSTCAATVPIGATVQIYYRGLYDVYITYLNMQSNSIIFSLPSHSFLPAKYQDCKLKILKAQTHLGNQNGMIIYAEKLGNQ